MENALVQLYSSSKTVFSVRDIALIWREPDRNRLKSRISYFVRTGGITRLTRGIYARKDGYSVRELATGIYTPSYVSFETVLRDAGFIFQHYDTIFVAGPWTRTVKIGENTFSFRSLKKSLLFNSDGVVSDHGASIATPERAFLDTLYLFPRFHFDNLGTLDWERCKELSSIYEVAELKNRVESYHKDYVES